jgi:putative zinc finger protein
MIPYVGCEYAREHLEAFADGELPVTEQVAVESHLRWCRTCAARVEDVRLIGDSIRVASPAQSLASDEARAVSVVHDTVLMRLRTERELSLATRIRDMFTDMRLLWPALGATVAVFFCVSGVVGVLQLASRERPESLAKMLETLSNPGTESNPLRPGNTARYDPVFKVYIDSNRSGGISIPRVLDDGAFEGLSSQDGMFAVAAVVTRDGRVANYELLSSERTGESEKPVHANELAAVGDVVRQSRFAPAQTSLGRTVAVNMVWLMVATTVKTPPPVKASTVRVTPTVQPPAAIAPVVPLEETPVKRSERAVDSTTA